jgi:hypothetical protein
METEKKTSVQLIRQYFTPPIPTMDEMKKLTAKDRNELADLIAAEKGLTKENVAGSGALYS